MQFVSENIDKFEDSRQFDLPRSEGHRLFPQPTSGVPKAIRNPSNNRLRTKKNRLEVAAISGRIFAFQHTQ
jgi:hypothetical protein